MSFQIDFNVDDAYADAVDVRDLRESIKAALRYEEMKRGSLSVMVGGDELVRNLNRRYRQIDAATDILSFPTEEDGQNTFPSVDWPPELTAELGGYLGDLVIAFPYTAAQAQRSGIPLKAELRLLVVHGTLHLLGYDHDIPEREAAMKSAQAAILRSLGDEPALWQRDHEW